jgi:hypothetical protein
VRYFFHLSRTDRDIIDRCGMELPNLEAARIEAIHTAMLVRSLAPAPHLEEAVFRISDISGKGLMTIRFRDVFASSPQGTWPPDVG